MGARTERLGRALHVGRVARRGGLLRVLRELGVWGNRPATREGAREFRQALEELGTTYIKLGQLLASRPDLLPDVYIEELEQLVDQISPVPFEDIQRVIETELPREVFGRIDPEPLATASIAQVHTALLRSGREVIVKVRRPGIEKQIELDLALLRSTAERSSGDRSVPSSSRRGRLPTSSKSIYARSSTSSKRRTTARRSPPCSVTTRTLSSRRSSVPTSPRRCSCSSAFTGGRSTRITASRLGGRASSRGDSSAPTSAR